MRTATLILLLFLPATFVFAQKVDDREKQRKKAPPLSLEGFLNEKLPSAKKDQVEMNVDNDPCYVCHANYKEEALVITHGLAEVGCIECHGESDDHRNDEDNITPPDQMYPLDSIDEMCSNCHDTHDAPAVKVLTLWKKRCPEKKDFETVVCTDCHFHHRLALRTVRWNKKTGKRIMDDETKPAAKAEVSSDKPFRKIRVKAKK